MPKPSHRETILTEGLRVVLERGFCGASVRDVVQAAGVPHGSFTNHFVSKEAVGLEILDLYVAQVREGIQKTLRSDSLPPLDRLRAWLDLQIRFLKKAEMRNGCPTVDCRLLEGSRQGPSAPTRHELRRTR